jgi:transcriptional regulator with XRE-family HTH domain
MSTWSASRACEPGSRGRGRRLASYQRAPSQLGAELRTLREASGLTGATLAQQAGWGQPKVSKIETGRQLPTKDDIRQWCRIVGASPAKAEELVAALPSAEVEHATWKEQYRAAGGGAGKQRDIRELEARATRVGEFQPAFIPGLLQTAQYARELLTAWAIDAAQGAVGIETTADVDRMVEARMERQQILYQPGKQVQQVILEGALYTRVCTPEALAGQLDRLIAVSSLHNVEFGIVPFSAFVPVFPICMWQIYDDELVVIESLTAEVQLHKPEEITLYDRFFELLRGAAASGPEAVALIHQALATLR